MRIRYRVCTKCLRKRRFTGIVVREEWNKITRRWTCSKGHFVTEETPTLNGVTEMLKSIYSAERMAAVAGADSLWTMLRRRT